MAGIMQIDPLESDDLEKRTPDLKRVEGLLTRLDMILETIRYEEPVPLMDMLLRPQPPEVFEIPKRADSEIMEMAETSLPEIEEQVEKYEAKLLELNERKSRFEDQKAELLPLRGMDFRIENLGKGDYSYIAAGTTRDLPGLQEAFESKNIHIHFEPFESDFSVIIIAHHSEVPTVERARRQRLYDSIEVTGLTGTPNQALENVETELISIGQGIDDVKKKKKELYRENRKELLIMKEELDILMEQQAIVGNFGETVRTVSLTGWIEQGMEEELTVLCEEATQGQVAFNFSDPEGEEAPTKLDNPGWARPFEGLINMFSPPRYNELDTTTIVGPLFIIFFGLMVGDAGYGLFLLAVAGFMHFKVGKHSEEIREYAYFLFLMGISAIVFGLIMGSFFYDSIQRFFYGDETLFLYPDFTIFGFMLPMDPMNDPATVFLVSLIIGLITLNIGIFLSLYHHLKMGNYFDMLTNDIAWLILQPGGIALIGAYMLGAFTLSSMMTTIAIIMTVVGLGLRIMQSKGLVMFDITGFAGNVLSFARILALALATAGLALAINYFTQLVSDIHAIMILIGILLFIIAHFGNTLLQSLGAGIHSLRLQYVELFSMFYEGGGKPFTPFKIDRQWTHVIEKEAES